MLCVSIFCKNINTQILISYYFSKFLNYFIFKYSNLPRLQVIQKIFVNAYGMICG